MLRAFAFLGFLLVMACNALAEPGHDGGHDHDPAPSVITADSPRLESVGTNMELVATSEGQRLVLYLDRSDSNEPIDGAEIELSGDGIATVQAKRVAPGTYEVEADWVDQPGTKALVFSIVTPDDADLLNGTWTLPEPSSGAESTIVTTPLMQLALRGDGFALIVGALALGFALSLAFRARRFRHVEDEGAPSLVSKTQPPAIRAIRTAAEMILLVILVASMLASTAVAGPGHDHGDGAHDAPPNAASGKAPRKLPDGSVFLPKSTQRLLQVRTLPVAEESTSRVRELIGTVVPDPSSFGQVQAPMDGIIEVTDRGISHVSQKVQAGEVLARLSPSIPVADLGTMQQLRAEVEGKLAVAQQKLDRLTRIASVVAKGQIDDTRAELAALREQKRVLEPKDTERIELKAPVSGLISVANVSAGQVVSARDTLFEIVDPDKLWVEGIGEDIHGQGDLLTAHAVDIEGHKLTLEYVGRSPVLRQQARPFLFRIDGAHADLAIGAPVKILVRTQQEDKGIVLPETAVVRGANGLPQVWIKESPERFRPSEVRTLPLDSGRTLIVGGVMPGERVVIGAAELINQVR